MGRLEGKSVVITGAGSGIGRAASLLFTKEGAKLIAVDRSESVKETAKLVSDAGGNVEAGMTKTVFDNAKQRGTEGKIGQLNPLKRAGQPHELAAMGLFLASDDTSYVNGQAIPVDGGLTASMPYTGKPI